MNRNLVDAWREGGRLLRAEWIADLQLGSPERRRDAILHASRRHPKADQLSSLPHPPLAREPKAQAGRVGKAAGRGVDDADAAGARAGAARLERAEPVLRQSA